MKQYRMSSPLEEHYTMRTEDFLLGMRLLQQDVDRTPQAIALLAIHSAISLADSLRLALGDDKLSADRHESAASTLRSLCNRNRITDLSGIANLEFLLSQKTSLSYGSKRLQDTSLQLYFVKAERFETWVQKTRRETNLKG